jgi:hypothetical protein
LQRAAVHSGSPLKAGMTQKKFKLHSAESIGLNWCALSRWVPSGAVSINP